MNKNDKILGLYYHLIDVPNDVKMCTISIITIVLMLFKFY